MYIASVAYMSHSTYGKLYGRSRLAPGYDEEPLMTKVAPDAVLHRLAAIPLFERCDRRQLARIANLGTASPVCDGTTLVTENRPARQFIVLMAGRARCSLEQCHVGELGAGALIGAASAIYGGPSPLTVVAQGRAEAAWSTTPGRCCACWRCPRRWQPSSCLGNQCIARTRAPVGVDRLGVVVGPVARHEQPVSSVVEQFGGGIRSTTTSTIGGRRASLARDEIDPRPWPVPAPVARADG